MSDQVKTQSQASAEIIESDLFVWIDRHFVQYKGSRAQLEAEGIIPKDICWPIRKLGVKWAADGLRYHLSRTRFVGMNPKGSIKGWEEADCWAVNITVAGRTIEDEVRQKIELKAKALRDEIYAYSPAGVRERNALDARFYQARKDYAFQQFRIALLPKRKKPGPKPKPTLP